MLINHPKLGILECVIEKGNTNSAVDVFISSAVVFSTGRELDDNEIDELNSEFSGEIQAYAVDVLGCHWE